MDRTLTGDLDGFLSRGFSGVALEYDRSGQLIDPVHTTVHTLHAICCMDLGMTDVHGEGGDLPALAFGVEGKSHGGARGKPRRQEVVRAGSAVEPTEGYGLIGEEPMPPDVHDLLKTTLARRADPYALIARSFRPTGKALGDNGCTRR